MNESQVTNISRGNPPSVLTFGVMVSCQRLKSLPKVTELIQDLPYVIYFFYTIIFQVWRFSPWHGPRPHVTDTGDGLQVWSVTANMLNKQWRTADKGWSSSLGTSLEPIIRHRKLLTCYEMSQGASNLRPFANTVMNIREFIDQLCNYLTFQKRPYAMELISNFYTSHW